jgi:hypothetical protein
VRSDRFNIDAGDLDKRVDIEQSAIGAADSRGHPAITWSVLVADAACKIETPNAGKIEKVRQLVPTATHVVEMRFRRLSEERHRLALYSVAAALNGGINNSTNTVVVDSAALITKGAVLKVDSELMQVTAIASLSLTVSRGYGGSTAAAHATGVNVLRKRVLNIGHQEDVGEQHVKVILTCTELKGATA